MKNIKIKASGKYLPKHKITNDEFAQMLNVTNEFVKSRTGILSRYYADEESISMLAINAVKDLIQKNNIETEKIEMIIVATTSTDKLMPGISYLVQKELRIGNCICLDILAGCAGFINAIDIARLYISTEKCKNALVIGVDKLTNYLSKDDISTSIVLSDGAGAIFIEATTENKLYDSYIFAEGTSGDILTCNVGEFIHMNGKEIYKYAVTETIKSVNLLLKNNNIKLDDINYLVFHQSNLRILESIRNKLKVPESKMFNNISDFGNTFNASIPILLDDMFEKGKIVDGNKILLVGYGGGLNTGSILMEV